MFIKRILWLSLLIQAGGNLFGAQLGPVYVAPDGDDRWSGRMEVRSADGTDGAKATLGNALGTLRAARQSAPASAAGTIILRGGVYPLTSPVTLVPADSGVTILAFHHEK